MYVLQYILLEIFTLRSYIVKTEVMHSKCPTVKVCKIYTYWHMSKYSGIGKKKKKKNSFFIYSKISSDLRISLMNWILIFNLSDKYKF